MAADGFKLVCELQRVWSRFFWLFDRYDGGNTEMSHKANKQAKENGN